MADINRNNAVLKSRRLKEHRDLMAIGRGPIVDVNVDVDH